MKRQSFVLWRFAFSCQSVFLALSFYERLMKTVLLAKSFKRFVGALPLRAGRGNNFTGLLYLVSTRHLQS